MKVNWGFREAWFVSLAIKILLAVLLPLSLDESYYWVWGQHPQLSYFDHPPMVGWLFFIGRAFEFLGGSSGRIPGVVLGHLTLLIWNELLKPYLSNRDRSLWLVLIVLSPLIGWGSLIQTPDVSFIFFWSLSTLTFCRALEDRRLFWYLALGASLGLGFCSKYPTVLFVPAIVLYLLIEKKWKNVRGSHVLLCILTGLLFCLPVLIWNAENDFSSFKFQLNHGLGAQQTDWVWTLRYLSEQFIFLFPPVVIFFFRSKVPKDLRALYYLALFPLAFFLVSSFKARVEPNWPIAAYPAFLTIAFFSLKNSRWYAVTVGIWLICFIVVLIEAFCPFLPIPPEKNKIHELRKYDLILPSVAKLDPLFASSYQIASALSFRLKRPVLKLQGMNRTDFFDFFAPAHAKSDKFFLVIEGKIGLPQWAFDEGYEIIQTAQVASDLKIVEVRKRAKASSP